MRRIRSKLGLSQEEFAERLRVARSTVSRWERDVHDIRYAEEELAKRLLQEWEEQLRQDG